VTTPLWLAEEAWLQELLNWFLDRLDTPRSQAVTRRVKQSTIPALFQFEEDTHYRWGLIERLASEYQVFSIHYQKGLDSFQVPYDNAQLRLNPLCEDLLRDWLKRPRQDPVTAAWQDAVSVHAGHFKDNGSALLIVKPSAPGYTPAELVRAFAAIPEHLAQELTLREVSARCFRGDSKFLDQRRDLLTQLFGDATDSIRPRPLLLTAWAPARFTQLLIVENQDSFLRLVEQPPAGYALLYSGGFRASASRLSSAHTRFAFLPGSDSTYFQQLWLDEHLPTCFWGDLDFSGMSILKALRNSLPQLQAWQPGYQPMLHLLENGQGHIAEQASKTGQIDPVICGCTYSDQTLLPALRKAQRFIDQEAIRPGLIDAP
jgi:Wadjet protein JetD, C-terminal